ncbi:MAG: hypothetical protein JWL76_2011 [Thermoleophilia bacterium]|nr:hypothetical protein [Thermoleophilia bacterium]
MKNRYHVISREELFEALRQVEIGRLSADEALALINEHSETNEVEGRDDVE